jgi:hypothetical protein
MPRSQWRRKRSRRSCNDEWKLAIDDCRRARACRACRRYADHLHDGNDARTTEAEMTKATLIARLLATIAAAALIVIAVFSPRLAAAGWLLALTYASLFPVGSLVLLMIYRLTGGRWGECLEPFLRPLSRSIPVLFLLVIPVLVATPVLFDWQHGFHGDITHSVRLVYLNVPSYIARSLVAVAGWSVLAYILPDSEHRSAGLIAGVGLLFHGIAVTVVGQDWVMVAEPEFVSTSFGASVAFTQLLAALALAAVLVPREHALPDLGALILVVTLGITYTDFMAVLVMWYGDVPSKVFWFVERIEEPWRAFSIAIFILVSFLPIVLLMFARVRNSRRALRFIGALSLTGLLLYQCWLLAPAYGLATLGTAALALIAMAAIVAAAATPARSQRRELAHGR